MRIDPSTVVWVIINFVILALLLNRFLFKPLLTFMRERQEKIDAGLAAGQRAQSDLEQKQAELADRLARARAETAERIAALEEQAPAADVCALPEQTAEDRRVEAAARLYVKEELLSDMTKEHAGELVALLEKQLADQLAGQTMPACDGSVREAYRALARQVLAPDAGCGQ